MLKSNMPAGTEGLAAGHMTPGQAAPIIGQALVFEAQVDSADAAMSLVDPERLDTFARGYTKMHAIGLGSMATIIVGGSGKCEGGSLAEAFGMEGHSDSTNFIANLATQAMERNEDPVEAVRSGGLGMIARTDESGDYRRAQVEPDAINQRLAVTTGVQTEELKKNRD